MRLKLLPLALLLVVASRPPAVEAAAPCLQDSSPQAQQAQVEVRREEWRDEARGRALPVKLYIPAGAAAGAGLPVVLLSHGLGGTREVGAYLGEHWAAGGYLVVAIQHPGSDDSVWRGVAARERMAALRAATRDPQNAINRPRDLSFVIDTLLAQHKRGEGPGAFIDPEQIAAAGHSFGAYTVLAVAGQKFGPRAASLGDPRVKAVIAMSPQAPKNDPAVAYEGVRVPILHLTGTEDTSPVDPEVTPEDRTEAFRSIDAADQYLVVFEGADHGVFSGAGRGTALGRRDRKLDETVQSLVQRSSLLFLDAFLRGEEASREKIRGGGLEEMVGAAGQVQRK